MTQLNAKQRSALERILVSAGPDYASVLSNMQMGVTAYSDHPALQAFYETLILAKPHDPLTMFVHERRPWPRWSADPASNLRRLSPRDVLGMTAWTLVCPENTDRTFAAPALDALAAAIAFEVLEGDDALPGEPVQDAVDFRTAWDLAHHYLHQPAYSQLNWTRQAVDTAMDGLPSIAPEPPVRSASARVSAVSSGVDPISTSIGRILGVGVDWLLKGRS